MLRATRPPGGAVFCDAGSGLWQPCEAVPGVASTSVGSTLIQRKGVAVQGGVDGAALPASPSQRSDRKRR